MFFDTRVRFVNHIKFNTVYIGDTNLDLKANVTGEVTINNFITDETSLFENPQIHATNKIYFNSKTKSIRFNQNNLSVDDVQIPSETSLMISPYIYQPTVINMILSEGAMQTKSLTIYFDDASNMYYFEIVPDFWYLSFYYQNGYERNATIGFNFTGEWENISDFSLKLLASDKNRQFIDTSGIPSNIKYTIEDDPMFHITPDGGDESEITGGEESESGEPSHGIRVKSLASFTIISFILITLLNVI